MDLRISIDLKKNHNSCTGYISITVIQIVMCMITKNNEKYKIAQ